MTMAQRIKQVLVSEAIHDRLPLDMNDLDESLFDFANTKNDGYFTVTRLHRDDLTDFDVKCDVISDESMQEIADLVELGICESGAWWDALEGAVDQVLGTE